MPTIPAKPDMLKAAQVNSDSSLKIDRKANILRGYTVAETGDFKDRRGSFDKNSLKRIVELGNGTPNGVGVIDERGLKSRLGHPNESDDGLTKHLGRSKNFRLENDGNRVVADLHFAPSALKEPVGGGTPLALYVMDRAEEDPGAISSSLVLRAEKLERRGADGKSLPSLWTPKELLASDIVYDGDAVHGDLLSVEALDEFMEGSERRIPTKLAVAFSQYLDQLFPESDREVLESRIDGWKKRYLSFRFGSEGELSHSTEDELTMDAETKSALEAQNKAFSDKLSSLESKLDGKLDKLSQMLEADAKAREAEKLASKRASEIAALCQMAGSDKAATYIADEKLSISDVLSALTKERQASNPLPGQADAANGMKQTLADPLAKLRAEWDAEKEDLTSKAGYANCEEYVKAQCLAKGLEYTEPKK